MTIEEFRQAVIAEFGPRLERATPVHMHEFLTRMQARVNHSAGDPPGKAFTLASQQATSYEQIIAEFLVNALDQPRDREIILLWMFAAELFYAGLGEEYESLSELFSDESP